MRKKDAGKPGLQKAIKIDEKGKRYVGVLVSPGHGAGWSTWNKSNRFKLLDIQLVFDPVIVGLVETKHLFDGPDEFVAAVNDHVRDKYDDEDSTAYLGGAENLTVRWVPEGRKFRIHEYDGYETVVLDDEDDWFVA